MPKARGKKTHHCPIERTKGGCRYDISSLDGGRLCVKHQITCSIHLWTHLKSEECKACERSGRENSDGDEDDEDDDEEDDDDDSHDRGAKRREEINREKQEKKKKKTNRPVKR